jgi:hypothetical protein
MNNPFYRKEYLPGYTGHVPFKNDLFGVTAGDANRILVSPKSKKEFYRGTYIQNTDPEALMPRKKQRARSQNASMSKGRPQSVRPRMRGVATGEKLPQGRKRLFKGRHMSVGAAPELTKRERKINDELMVSNRSRYAKNWIGGPTHEVKAQHVPGYRGHVHGVVSENLHGKSYARTTASSLNREMARGNDIKPEERFKTLSQAEFSAQSFRRYMGRGASQVPKKDYADYAKTINDENPKMR